jgi:hypothetical protein
MDGHAKLCVALTADINAGLTRAWQRSRRQSARITEATLSEALPHRSPQTRRKPEFKFNLAFSAASAPELSAAVADS